MAFFLPLFEGAFTAFEATGAAEGSYVLFEEGSALAEGEAAVAAPVEALGGEVSSALLGSELTAALSGEIAPSIDPFAMEAAGLLTRESAVAESVVGEGFINLTPEAEATFSLTESSVFNTAAAESTIGSKSLVDAVFESNLFQGASKILNNPEVKQVFQGLSDVATIAGSIGAVSGLIKESERFYNNISEDYKRNNNITTNIKDVTFNNKTGEIVDPYKLGYDLATYINETYKQAISGMSRAQAINNVIVARPELLYIAQEMDNFVSLNTNNMDQESLSSRFQNLDYETIRQVYNGRSLDPSKVFEVNENGQTRFAAMDETGKLEVYRGATNPYLGHLTTVEGNWMGPYSLNNAKPTSLLDLFSMLHDIEYDNVYFDNKADMKYVSRIEQNYDRMTPYERNLGKAAVKYFTTIGYTTSLLVNGPQNFPKNDPTINKQLNNDIYAFLMGNQDFNKRERFYQGFQDAMKVGQHEVIKEAQATSNLLALFDNLIIEDIY